MKHIIIMGTLVLIGVTIVATGLWYQQEQKKQFEYEQINAIQDRTVDTSGSDSDNQDPFGLFGAQEVVYEVTFETLWSEQSHGVHWVRSAHFSAPVLWVGNNNPVFSLGDEASPGMEEMAETGRTADLKKELEEMVSTNVITGFQIGERVETPNRAVFNVTVSRDSPVISLVSMIAPSPDWFVTVEGLNLLKEGRWIEEETIQTLVLDAGTEDGAEFSITNSSTDPRSVIGELTDIPSRSLRPFASVTFKQIGYEGN